MSEHKTNPRIPSDPATDTIVAPATASGAAGVAILRLSGPNAQSIARRMTGSLPPPRTASLRTFRDAAGDALDRGIVLHYPGPDSYTGEDVIELQGHGGPVIVAALTRAAIELGARHAEPGEFSRRAFLNGRLDLAQAEAVADLVASGTERAARAALRSLTGRFSDAVGDLEAALIELRTHVEAAIDFPEEDIDFLADAALRSRIDGCADRYEVLNGVATTGRLLNDGFQVVIAGRPNAGKSSLLNRLSGEDSAIVTEVAGTTRDVLRETIDLDGLAVELVDTAGLREDPDRIEAEGIRRARRALEQADAVLVVVDAAAPDTADVTLPDGLPRLTIRNKIDLTGEDPGATDGVVRLSAQTGAGLPALRDAIKQLAGFDSEAGDGALTARQRHLDALAASEAHFNAGVDALEASSAGEILAEELRLATDALGEITGRLSSDDLLGHIFSTFCIGK